MPSITDKFAKSAPNASTLLSGDHTSATTTLAFTQPIALPTTTPSWVTMIVTDATGQVTTYESVKGIYVSGSNSLTLCTRGAEGTQQAWPANTKVFATVTAGANNDLIDGILASHNPDGSLLPAAVATALNTGNLASTGFNALPYTFNSVTYNGNRSYTCVINGQDLTGTLSPGFRVRTQRTVSAPTQCSSLNGTTQYFSKAAPAGMTFTNNFTLGAAVKPSSYALGTIISRYDGTSGFALRQIATGQIEMTCYNAGAANFFRLTSYQSVPLNKWVNNVVAQVDMTVTTNTPTTNYITIDGADIPLSATRGGTAPTALIQAGNLVIGAEGAGTNPYAGKIAQAFVYSAKVTEATTLAAAQQGLAGTETSLISAYSLSGASGANDLNTTNANNLTANGSATTTNADAPWGGQANGTISATLDYGIVQSVSFSTNTTVVVQVPEGCTIPTSGGVSAVSYSSNKVPYLFPSQRGKWQLEYQVRNNDSGAVNASQIYQIPSVNWNIPIGEWVLSSKKAVSNFRGAGTFGGAYAGLSTSTTAFSDRRFIVSHYHNSNVASITQIVTMSIPGIAVSLSAATPFYILKQSDTTDTTMDIRGDLTPTLLLAENAYL